jgi:APA family basic amino acid/polyamine antiporter
MFRVGATIGTVIFIVLTEAVPEAGPGVVVSFALAGITAALTVVCYAELASTIPVSGSSYSYIYATMGEIVAFGLAGIGAAAGSIFFSFIGLDAVSTAGEEVHNPRRNLPLAIVFATIIVTTFYILVALAGVGAQPYQQFAGQEAGLSAIMRNITGSTWPAAVLAAGATILYGQSRILFAMGRDGMLPEIFHRVDPRTLAPVRNTVIVCTFVGLLAGFVPLGVLIDLTSMGTLVAFTVVSIGVMILRYTQPDLPRGFRVPGYPVTPILSAAFALYLISGLPYTTFALFAVWLGVAAIIYFTYSAKHSLLARGIVVATEEEPR